MSHHQVLEIAGSVSFIYNVQNKFIGKFIYDILVMRVRKRGRNRVYC